MRTERAEAGSAERWFRDMWAARDGIAPPAPGKAASVRWALYETDASLNQSLISEGTTVSQLFDQDKWERHRRVDRYWRHIQPASLLSSTVFRRIFRPCAQLALLALALSAFNLGVAPRWALPQLHLHMAPVSLLAPVIGLLLVFRANHSYARFCEGRLLWGTAVRVCRDVARLLTAVLPPSPPRAELLGHLQSWAWLLKSHLRAGRTRADPSDPTSYRDDPSREVRASLPPDLAEPLLAAQNRPLVALCALTSLQRHLERSLPDYAAKRLEEALVELGAVTGGCERLLSTPIPLSYSRFTGRALVSWLAAVPLALWPLCGWATPAVTFALAYIVLGIDEIGVEIEEPFAILPLQALCEAIRRDVGIAERAAAAGARRWPGHYEDGAVAQGQLDWTRPV
jgi:putative membrane protein